LAAQAELLVQVLGDERLGVTRGEPTPELNYIEASRWLRDNFIPEGQRARLFDVDGIQVADSYEVTEAISGEPLPPALPAGVLAPGPDAEANARDTRKLAEARRALADEVENALEGRSSA